MNCTENIREKNYYKEKIIELVEKIENPEFLEFLYQMLLSFKEKEGHLMPLFLVPIGCIIVYSLSMLIIQAHQLLDMLQ